MADRWIVIPNWDQYQHYKDRDPSWIKDHLAQLHKDEYRGLTFAQRGLLKDIRQEYASSHRALSDDTAALSRRLGQRVLRAQLDALNHAGFIEFSASRPLAPLYHDASPEKIREEDPLTPTPSVGASTGIMNPDKLVNCAACGAPVERGHTCPECGASPRTAGSNHRATRKQSKRSPYEVAELMTRNVGWQYPLDAYRDELNRFDLASSERDLLEHLWSKLASEPARPDAEPEPVRLEELF